jgi:purine-nucleoside phosphorylase
MSWNWCSKRRNVKGLSGKADLAVVLGSGLSTLEELVEIERSVAYEDVPGLRRPTAPGHQGTLALVRLAGRNLYLFSGRLHCYEGLMLDEAGSAARVAAGLGCKRLLLTQAAGSLRRDVPVGTWMLADDIVSFPWSASRLASCGGGEAAPKRLLAPSFAGDIRAAACNRGIHLHGGTLFWTVGPCYETCAEARAAVELGACAASMSALPELEAARRSGIEAALLSYITNHAASVTEGRIDHERVVETAGRGVRTLAALLEGLLSGTRNEAS